jgi:uncharacterized protein YjbJ (UPF0337 family)
LGPMTQRWAIGLTLTGGAAMGGTGDKIKGKANEVTGKVTGDKTQKMKGKGQQLKGGMKNEAKAENKRKKKEA